MCCVHIPAPRDVEIAAHDLRRTFGKLALQGDARIEQISLSLEHASIRRRSAIWGSSRSLASRTPSAIAWAPDCERGVAVDPNTDEGCRRQG